MNALRSFLLAFLVLLVLVSLAGLFVFLAYKGTPAGSAWWPPSLTAVSAGWDALPATKQGLVGLGVAVLFGAIGVVGLFLPYLERRQARPPLPTNQEGFPFEIFSTSQFDVLKKHFLGQYASLEHQSRFPPPRQVSFEAELDTKFLILTGRTGLGKTRECIELFRRLAETKGEEVTILCPHEDFDRPRDRDIPPGFAPRNLVLFIDDIHQRCNLPRRGVLSTDTPTRTFHDRLSATIEWIRERYAGRDWRVVLTAGDEPELRPRLRLDAAVWSGFKEYQLPAVHRDARPAFICAVAKHFVLDVEKDAVAHVAAASDGTCSGIITALARESFRRSGKSGVLTLQDLREYDFRYPADWERRVYQETIAPYPDRGSVFQALSGLYQLHVPAHRFLVVDLAARLGQRGRFRWLKKRRIARTIRRDLWAWMFEYRGELICPAAYLEGRTALAAVLPQVLSTLQHAAGNKEHLVRLLPALPGISSRLGLDLGFPDEALTLLRAGIKRLPHSAPLWTVMAVLLARVGRHHESLQAAEAAVRADNQSSAALVVLAYGQSRIGLHDRAIETAREATKLAPNDDYVWLNLGVVLSKRGLHEEAISALRLACELNPQSAKAWYSLGVVYDQNNQRDKAINACKEATKLDPLDPDAWHTLGIAYDRSGETDNALDALRRAQQLDDSDGATRLSLSRALFSGGHTEEALAALKDAEMRIRVTANPDLLGRVSIAYGKNGMPMEAVRVAKEALKIDPKHLDAWRSLARNLADLPGQEEEAQQARVRIGELCRTAEDWWDLSVSYGRSGHFEEAVTAARNAVGIDPKHLDAWRSLARDLAHLPGHEEEVLHVRSRVAEAANTADDWFSISAAYGTAGHYKEAVEAADRAIALDHNHVGSWRSRAMNLDQLGQSEQALVAWKRLDELVGEAGGTSYVAEADEALHEVEENPASTDSWKRLATVYRRAGQAVEAVSVARKIVERLPHIAPHTIGLVEELLNQEPQTIASFMECLVALDRNNGQYVHLLGAARLKIGDMQKAIEAFRAACDLDPKRENYWYGLGKALEKQGNHDAEARRAYERAILLRPDYTKAHLALGRLAKQRGNAPAGG